MARWGIRGVTGVVFAVMLVVGGCHRVQPIYKVEDHPVPAAAQKADLVTLETAIYEAASSTGWLVEKVNPGLMRATQKWREHAATVDIVYSQKSYSINYAGSANLKADQDFIHRRYNSLVVKLEQEIERRLYKVGS
ncbi:hypothetical protein [Ferrovibrio terrae]|uniref:hypothetical protein n=1 Tax=Ferrovibrio terrae TaxID=2594003 RepID=UPI003137DD75